MIHNNLLGNGAGFTDLLKFSIWVGVCGRLSVCDKKKWQEGETVFLMWVKALIKAMWGQAGEMRVVIKFTFYWRGCFGSNFAISVLKAQPLHPNLVLQKGSKLWCHIKKNNLILTGLVKKPTGLILSSEWTAKKMKLVKKEIFALWIIYSREKLYKLHLLNSTGPFDAHHEVLVTIHNKWLGMTHWSVRIGITFE